MKFLIDANLPQSSKQTFAEFDHDALHVRDVGLRHASDGEIAGFAREHDRILVTRDIDFADVRQYPPHENPGIVVLRLPETSVSETINQTLRSFLTQDDVIAQLPGRLAIVESGRIRLRE